MEHYPIRLRNLCNGVEILHRQHRARTAIMRVLQTDHARAGGVDLIPNRAAQALQRDSAVGLIGQHMQKHASQQA
ncbi:MAG: hypothetical protein KatS3mg021_2614 [Fimbriimonadales bacterium]|nr:MAG: hypothetical protein KatS3mg021_2614 [Fimbriimonadales bacterium]